MSTLRVTNVQDTAGANSLTTAQIYNGAAKAWVNFNGKGAVAIRANFNVSSITDNGTGDYTVNFSNAFSDANYSAVGTASEEMLLVVLNVGECCMELLLLLVVELLLLTIILIIVMLNIIVGHFLTNCFPLTH